MTQELKTETNLPALTKTDLFVDRDKYDFRLVSMKEEKDKAITVCIDNKTRVGNITCRESIFMDTCDSNSNPKGYGLRLVINGIVLPSFFTNIWTCVRNGTVDLVTQAERYGFTLFDKNNTNTYMENVFTRIGLNCNPKPALTGRANSLCFSFGLGFGLGIYKDTEFAFKFCLVKTDCYLLSSTPSTTLDHPPNPLVSNTFIYSDMIETSLNMTHAIRYQSDTNQGTVNRVVRLQIPSFLCKVENIAIDRDQYDQQAGVDLCMSIPLAQNENEYQFTSTGSLINIANQEDVSNDKNVYECSNGVYTYSFKGEFKAAKNIAMGSVFSIGDVGVLMSSDIDLSIDLRCGIIIMRQRTDLYPHVWSVSLFSLHLKCPPLPAPRSVKLSTSNTEKKFQSYQVVRMDPCQTDEIPSLLSQPASSSSSSPPSVSPKVNRTRKAALNTKEREEKKIEQKEEKEEEKPPILEKAVLSAVEVKYGHLNKIFNDEKTSDLKILEGDVFLDVCADECFGVFLAEKFKCASYFIPCHPGNAKNMRALIIKMNKIMETKDVACFVWPKMPASIHATDILGRNVTHLSLCGYYTQNEINHLVKVSLEVHSLKLIITTIPFDNFMEELKKERANAVISFKYFDGFHIGDVQYYLLSVQLAEGVSLFDPTPALIDKRKKQLAQEKASTDNDTESDDETNRKPVKKPTLKRKKPETKKKDKKKKKTEDEDEDDTKHSLSNFDADMTTEKKKDKETKVITKEKKKETEKPKEKKKEKEKDQSDSKEKKKEKKNKRQILSLPKEEKIKVPKNVDEWKKEGKKLAEATPDWKVLLPKLAQFRREVDSKKGYKCHSEQCKVGDFGEDEKFQGLACHAIGSCLHCDEKMGEIHCHEMTYWDPIFTKDAQPSVLYEEELDDFAYGRQAAALSLYFKNVLGVPSGHSIITNDREVIKAGFFGFLAHYSSSEPDGKAHWNPVPLIETSKCCNVVGHRYDEKANGGKGGYVKEGNKHPGQVCCQPYCGHCISVHMKSAHQGLPKNHNHPLGVAETDLHDMKKLKDKLLAEIESKYKKRKAKGKAKRRKAAY